MAAVGPDFLSALEQGRPSSSILDLAGSRLARTHPSLVASDPQDLLLTSPDVAEDLELAESVSVAMLTLLETLTPIERAVFVLREVFDVPGARLRPPWTSRTPRSVRWRTAPAST